MASLKDACIATIAERARFWILAALTDRSYEEGIRNPGFRDPVSAYAHAGVPEALLQQLRLGINGNLCETLGNLLPGLNVVRNQWAGQDIRIFDAHGNEHARVESKPLFDLTLNKHYWTTAQDFEKLRTVRRGGFPGALFLAVFFIQLPNYCYGPGHWYGRWCDRGRDGYQGTWGIEAQYKRLRTALTVDPAWPSNVPHTMPLVWEHDFGELRRWFTEIFRPAAGWSLEPECLKDAAVGVSLWECP